jgi:hypothetical protein
MKFALSFLFWTHFTDNSIRTKTTCVTKVEKIYMWLWKNEHNYLEKEKNHSSIVICYNVLQCSENAAPALVLEYYVGAHSYSLFFFMSVFILENP